MENPHSKDLIKESGGRSEKSTSKTKRKGLAHSLIQERMGGARKIGGGKTMSRGSDRNTRIPEKKGK